VSVSFNALGKRWRFNGSLNACDEISPLDDHLLVSPDGQKGAFIREHNLWLRNLITGEERALTTDGTARYAYADAPAAYGAKITMEGIEAIWSPDSQKLFTLQLDTRQVKHLPLMEYAPSDGAIRPCVVYANRPVAFPEDENVEEYRFLSIDVESGQHQDAHFRRSVVFYNSVGFFTCQHGWGSNDSRHAYFIDMERGNLIARVLELDTVTGQVRVVIEEKSNICFRLSLNLEDQPVTTYLPETDEIIWYSERSGWAHLYLYDAKTGTLKNQVTSGNWLVRDILSYDTSRRELTIQTANRIEGRNPYFRDICTVNIDTSELVEVFSPDQECVVINHKNIHPECLIAYGKDIRNSSGIAPSGDYIVSTVSRVDQVPKTVLLNRKGQTILEIETADVSGLPENWQWPEPVIVKGDDNETDIYAVIYRPSDFSEAKSYPIIDYSVDMSEGDFTPAGSFTNTQHCGIFYLSAAAYAELGFIVVMIEGRGMGRRNKAFFDDKNIKYPSGKNQLDRIAVITRLAEKYPYMDINRVGVGEMPSSCAALNGVLGHPNFYKVGVAHNPLSDLRAVSSFYADEVSRERFDHRVSKKPLEDYADNISGKLLLMHGMMDPTIPVAGTFRLIQALENANKDFDLLLLPNGGHFLSSYAKRRAMDYFVKHLLGMEPPKEFKLITSIDIMIQAIYGQQLEASTGNEDA
jgi:dipeptidyl aminopeptidase/acylaminoacyl peptidase